MVTFLVFLLVLFSFALVIGVPVVVASPGEWETSKSNIFGLGAAWSGLVLVTGLIASSS
jgi:photosystem II PsbZ protein|tara:strand:- start:1009 stop:1185 length:177 start_codon:yes stop_codon:yes gene_type:complete